MTDEELWHCWAAAAYGLDIGAVDWQEVEGRMETAQEPLRLDWAKIQAATGLEFNAHWREHIDRGLLICIQENEKSGLPEATHSRYIKAADKAIADLRSAMSSPLGAVMFPEATERFAALESFTGVLRAVFAPKVVHAALKATVGTTETTRGILWAAMRFREAYFGSGGQSPTHWAKGTTSGGKMLLGLHEALHQAIGYPLDPHDSKPQYNLARWLERNLPPTE